MQVCSFRGRLSTRSGGSCRRHLSGRVFSCIPGGECIQSNVLFGGVRICGSAIPHGEIFPGTQAFLYGGSLASGHFKASRVRPCG